MNFIKLLPILFLGLPYSGHCRPLEQQLLPAIPGYVPVYIQTGNMPPDVESLYLGRQAAPLDQTVSASQSKETKLDATSVKEEKPIIKEGPPQVEVTKQQLQLFVTEVEKPNEPEQKPQQEQIQEALAEDKEQELKKKQPPKKVTSAAGEDTNEEAKPSESSEPLVLKPENSKKDTLKTGKISQYQVKEAQIE